MRMALQGGSVLAGFIENVWITEGYAVKLP